MALPAFASPCANARPQSAASASEAARLAQKMNRIGHDRNGATKVGQRRGEPPLRARALPAQSWGRLRRGSPRPPPTKRCRWSAIVARRLVGGMFSRLPPPRLLAGGVVEINDHLPNLLLAQQILPRRHHRILRRRIIRQTRIDLGDQPE